MWFDWKYGQLLEIANKMFPDTLIGNNKVNSGAKSLFRINLVSSLFFDTTSFVSYQALITQAPALSCTTA